MSDGPDDLSEENERLREELESLKAKEKKSKSAARRRVRTTLFVFLVVLTSISMVATTLGVWVNRTLWNTDKYLSTVVPLAKDPAVIEAMATKLTDEVFTALDVQGKVEDALSQLAANTQVPAQVTFLAGPLTDSARNVIHDQVVKFLNSDAFQNLWLQLNERLHPKIVALLQGNYDQLPNVSVTGGDVQLNLIPAVVEVIRNVAQQGLGALDVNVTIPDIPANLDASQAIQQLASALGVSLPSDFGQVTIMSADQLHSYQTAAKNVRIFAWALLLLTVVLLALSLVAARNRRRALIWLALGAVAALWVGGVLIRRVNDTIVNAISSGEAKSAARNVLADLFGNLRHAGLLVVWAAVIVAVIAYFVGRPAWMTKAWGRTKRAFAARPGGSEIETWVAERADGARIVGIAVALVLLFITGIDWLPVILIGAALALFLWWVAVAQQHTSAGEAAEA